MADQSLEELFAQSIDSASVPYYSAEDLYKQAVETPIAPSTSVSTPNASNNKQSNPILQEAQKAVKSYESAATAAIKKQETISAQSAKASKEIISSTESIGRAQEVITKQTGIAELENQNARMAAYEAAGGSEALTMLNKQLLADTKATQQAQAEVDKIEGRKVTGVLDYIGQQLALIMPNDRLYNADQKRLETANLIATVTASQDRINKTILEHKKNVNIAIIEEQAKAAHALTVKNVSDAELKSLATNSAQLAAGMQASRDVLNSRLESYKLFAQEEGRQQRQQEFDLQKQSLEIRLKEYNLSYQKAGIDIQTAKARLEEATDPKKKAAAQAQYDMVIRQNQDLITFRGEATANVQRAQALLKQPVESESTIMYGINSPKSHDKYMTMFAMGAGKDPVVGHTVGDTLINLDTISPVGIQDLPMMQPLEEVKKRLMDEYSKPGKTVPKDKNIIKSDLNRVAKDLFTQYAKDIKTGDSSNFYQAPPMQVLADYATVQETPLWKKVLEPMKLTEANPKTIFDASIAGIKSGAVSVEDVTSGIEAIYKAAIDWNNSHYNFAGAGLPVQTSYITSSLNIGPTASEIMAIGISGGLDRKIKTSEMRYVDLHDPVQIKNALIKYIANEFGNSSVFNITGVTGEGNK